MPPESLPLGLGYGGSFFCKFYPLHLDAEAMIVLYFSSKRLGFPLRGTPCRLHILVFADD